MGRRLYREYDENGNLVKLECCKCGEIKTVDNFNKNKSKKDGVYNICKECRKEYNKNNREKEYERQRRYYENNKDRERKKRRQYYENNQEKESKRKRQRYENNKEKVLGINRRWRENNKEKLFEINRQYRENNKEKISKTNRQYRENKAQREIMKIYENVTKQRYPHEGIQYGVIYGVYCRASKKWYIGQTTTSFNIRYSGDFFNHKIIELSEDSFKGQLLADDIEKYGQENFEIFEVLDVAFSERELDEKEAYYIDLYKAYDEGYNSTRGNIFKHDKEKRSEAIVKTKGIEIY